VKQAWTGRWANIAAYVLGVLWLGFGVMHFGAHDETLRQMPSYFPWKSFWVYATGVAEILVGVGLFVGRTRPLAARTSILLLVIYTPAVIHIVAHDVIPIDWPQGLRWFFRWFMAPINVGMGYWAYAFVGRSASSNRSQGSV
jgi:uncharacterized membrane protein